MRRSFSLFALLLLALSAAAQPVPPETFSHFLTADSVQISYRVAGHGDGPPVVFLHGGPGYNSHSFAVQTGPALEPHLRMVYLDQRGCGRSERPTSGAYSLDALVDDIEQLRRHLGAERIVPMGHSFGGALALEYAARHPERVAALVLVAPLSDAPASIASWHQAVRQWHPALAATADSTGNWGEAIAAAGGQAFFNRMQFTDDGVRRRQDSLDAASGLANTGEMSSALWNQGLGAYRFTATERLTMPVLLVAGAHDRAIGPATTDALAARLPHAVYRRYENVAHFAYLEAPDRFADDVTVFLAGLRW